VGATVSNDLISHAGREAAKAVPPVVVSAIGLIANGLPFVISLLTLIYLAVQIGHLLWVWAGEIRARRAARRGS
jgi:hypothetical protein